MNEQAPQPVPEQIPGQGQLFTDELTEHTAEGGARNLLASDEAHDKEQSTTNILPNTTASEHVDVQHENTEQRGIFKGRWNSLRRIWQRTKEAKTTEILVRKPVKLIGSAAVFGAMGTAYLGVMSYRALDKGMLKLTVNLEAQEADRLDGYDSYTPANRIRSRIQSKPLKLRPPSVMDQIVKRVNKSR